MSSRKSLRLPIIITFIFIIIIIYLFTSIKQSKIICEKTKTFDGGVKLNEYIDITTDGRKINEIDLSKKIYFSDRYINNFESLDEVKNVIKHTLDYLGNNVKYDVLDDSIIVKVIITKNELILLDNISFIDNGGKIEVTVNTNTKSSDVVALKVGDNFLDGELQKMLKNRGYSCQ